MPDLRKDPVLDRWVIIAAERGQRPVDFQVEPEPSSGKFSPFTPGNEHLTPPEIMQIGRDPELPENTSGWRVRVVPNKYPALQDEGELNYQGVGMFDQMNAVGAHEVIIENPRADWEMTDATPTAMRDVFTAYIARMVALQRDPRFRYVLVFRNKGAAAGATVAHPHSQVIALPIVPEQEKERLNAAREYYRRKKRCLFDDILRQELASGERIVEETEHFIVLSPFAARFPFELQIFPKRHSHDFTTLTDEEMLSLGELVTRLLQKLKKLLGDPAYNLMVHSCPSLQPQPGNPHHWDTIAHDYLWHIGIVPRLTKVAGFEWGTGFYINPVAPELATRLLRETSV